MFIKIKKLTIILWLAIICPYFAANAQTAAISMEAQSCPVPEYQFPIKLDSIRNMPYEFSTSIDWAQYQTFGFRHVEIAFHLPEEALLEFDVNIEYIPLCVPPCHPEPMDWYMEFFHADYPRLLYYSSASGGDKCISLAAGTYYWITFKWVNYNNDNWDHKVNLNLKFTPSEYTGSTGPDPAYPTIRPSSNKNYIVKGQATTKMTTAPSAVTPASMNYTVDYYDGLGRPEQSVSVAHITNIEKTSWWDHATHYNYDPYGRETRTWLPVPVYASGAYVTTSRITSQANNHYTDAHAYTETLYENSPLSRPTGNFKPGAAYHSPDKPSRINYGANARADVLDLKYNNTNRTLSAKTATSAALFSYESVIDEDGGTVTVYKNSLGQKVLERVVNKSANGTQVFQDTYYAYDGVTGQLSVVIPPKATDIIRAKPGIGTGVLMNLVDDEFWRLCYLYEYDSRRRLIEKKLPGAQPEYYIYDKADRMIFSQDALQRSRGEWTFAIPDAFNRVVLTGTCKNSLNHRNNPIANALVRATWANANNTYKGYNVSGVTLTTPTVLEVNYYDQYNFINKNSVPASLTYAALNGFGTKSIAGTSGLLTGKMTAQVTTTGIGSYVYSAVYYDYMGRTVQSRATNHLGGLSLTHYNYDFAGNMLAKRESHQPSASAAADVLLSNYTYDKWGRLITETTTLNGAGKAFIRHGYNGLGQLRYKAYGEGTNAVNEFYKYNTQGWLTEQSSDLFDMKLRYYDRQKAGTAARWSGDITEWEWQHKGSGANNAAKNTYAFTYDQTGRLLDSKLYEGTGTTATSKFTEQGISYDKNGNILTLDRYSSTGTLDDDFCYTYNGNQLSTLSGDGVEVTALDFPRSGYAEYNNWAVNNSIHTSRALIQTPSNGFGGAYNRFEVVSTGTLNLSIYNTYLHHVYLPRKDVIITVEYRSNYDLLDSNTGKVVLPAHTGNARTVSFCLEGTYHSIWNGSASPGSWLEIRTIKMEHRATPMDFPRSGYAEYNNWAVNNSIHTSRALIQTPSNGFGGAYNRFEVVSTGTLNLSIYNTYLHHVYLPRKDVIITVEYRSNYDLLDSNTGKVVLPAHTGNARTVSFCLEGTYHSIWNGSASPGSWLEIRTVKMEHRATPMDFPCEGFSEENNWGTNHAIYTSKAIKQTPANGFSGAYSRFEAIPGGTLRPSIYNSYVHNKSLRYTPLVITIEYRSNYPLSEKATGGKILIPANTGNAKRVSFSFDDTSFSLLTTVAAADAWMEIRTIKIEKKNAEGGTIYHYAYDANGNMTTDGLHGLTLEYNHMNLVQTVKEGNTVKAGYRWLADGTKTGVNTSTGFTGTGYEYLGSLVYKRTGAALSLESASFGGGRIIRSIGSTATYTPYYFITDHLGSTRVIIVGSSSYPRFNYYPFGGDWNRGMERSENRYLYNGKESQKDFGITYLDYGARKYDARIGRWFNIDPLAEVMSEWSPYNMTLNSPMNAIDPDGLFPYWITGEDEPEAPKTEPAYEVVIEPVVVVAQKPNNPSWADVWVPGWEFARAADVAWSKGNYWDYSKNMIFGMADMLSTAWGGGVLKAGVKGGVKVTTGGVLRGTVKEGAKKIVKPKGWKTVVTNKKNGIEYIDPSNPHNRIRIMNGNPNSPNPAQQKPYVRYQKNGYCYDVNGNKLTSGNLPEAHIPLEHFDMSKMPTF